MKKKNVGKIGLWRTHVDVMLETENIIFRRRCGKDQNIDPVEMPEQSGLFRGVGAGVSFNLER